MFTDYQRVSSEFHGIYLLALQNNDIDKAHRLVAKQGELAKCFEMGKYYEVSSRLEIATLEKNADAVLDTMEKMLSNIQDISHYTP